MRFRLLVTVAIFRATLTAVSATDYPSAVITNGVIKAEIFLPESTKGFYRGTRFDWSGVIYSLEVNGHDYYGPWFSKTDPTVHDFVYRDADIVAGSCSAITGPVDEFGPLGYEEARVGDTFVKIGVGALRKAGNDKYDNFHLYEIADGGKWTIRKRRDGLELTQTLDDGGSGYSYVYEKQLQLTKGKAEMLLTHRLKNVGKRPIRTTVYNHNFLVLDHRAPGPGVTISVPFAIQTSQAPDSELAAVRGSQVVYVKSLEGRDKVVSSLEGFGGSPKDSRIRIEDRRVGAGLSWQTDKPLLRQSLWSIRSVIAVEPFVSLSIEPGAEFTWQTVYNYYLLPEAK